MPWRPCWLTWAHPRMWWSTPAMPANTGQVLAAAGDLGLGDLVAARAREVALATLAGETDVEVCIFDRDGGLVGHARP